MQLLLWKKSKSPGFPPLEIAPILQLIIQIPEEKGLFK